MTSSQLIALVGRRGVASVARCTASPVRIEIPGTDLSGWRSVEEDGAFLFWSDVEGRASVVFIEAPGGDRAAIQAQIDKYGDGPTILVLMVPGGQPP